MNGTNRHAATWWKWGWVAAALALALTAGRAAAETVSIEGKSFSPAKLTIKAGESVTWVNNSSTDHALTGDVSSGAIKPGKSFTQRFKKPGKYTYGCDLHPREKGTITVTE